MSGWRAASRADEDLSPDQSCPALTATAGPVLKLDGSPASPQPALLAPAPWLDTARDIPARGAPCGQRIPHRHCSHSWAHTIPLRRAVRWLGITQAPTGG